MVIIIATVLVSIGVDPNLMCWDTPVRVDAYRCTGRCLARAQPTITYNLRPLDLTEDGKQRMQTSALHIPLPKLHNYTYSSIHPPKLNCDTYSLLQTRNAYSWLKIVTKTSISIYTLSHTWKKLSKTDKQRNNYMPISSGITPCLPPMKPNECLS